MNRGRSAALVVSALAAVVALGCADLDELTGGSFPTNPTTATVPTTPTDAPNTTTTTPSTTTTEASSPGGPETLIPDAGVARLVPEVVSVVAHDPEAFTQGLEYHNGALLESTGRYGRSDRRRVDPATGEVLTLVPLPPDHFGEGLTVVDGRLVQLTWREGIAHVADPLTLEATGELRYDGEGWGLCFDGSVLWMSDGSATLTIRDPQTFEARDRVEVRLDGAPVDQLNELECSDGLVWANRWLTTEIVAIAPGTGEVRAVVDASSLVPEGLDDPDAVLNGIAARPDTDTFWLTGKNWPVLYEVRLVASR
jgi:glutaminyl-peptide cyclotransferase